MAEVSAGAFSPQLSGSYFPAIPPKTPKAASSYCRAITDAPYTALLGVVVDGRQPNQHPVTPRCRVRAQVGSTNRWRLPQSLGSDLLGTCQAYKAIQTPCNETMLRICTADNPRNSINLDMEQPYKFRVSGDRPVKSVDEPPADGRRSQNAFSPVSPAKYYQSRVIPKVMPTTARTTRPLDIFHYHSKKSLSATGPDGIPVQKRERKLAYSTLRVDINPYFAEASDALLQCLGINFELHRPYLQKAETLCELIENAENPSPKRYYRSKMSETLDNYISKSECYSNEYQEMSNRLSTVDVDDTEGKGVAHPKHVSEQRVSNKTVITLDIKDPLITKQALAVALGNLYHDHVEVEVNDVVPVLAAAFALKFKHLEDGCAKLMLKSISAATVCTYHEAAQKYQQDTIKTACERWLELNLVDALSREIQLRQLPMDLLQKIVSSNRLFVFGEYALYRKLCYWVFLQMNPSIQLMPSYSTIVTFFNSLPKTDALIAREDGQHFKQLFQSLRLHGITDTNHMHDVQNMNIIPQAWVVKILTSHYHALQGGGDMSTLAGFNTGSIRQGFVIDDEPHYHSEIMSLHGFHFELKAVKEQKAGSYSFYMQRLKPGDPILSFRHCERHTFSMRPDREVAYSIRVQHFDSDNQCHVQGTGVMTQKLGLGAKTSKSQWKTWPSYITVVSHPLENYIGWIRGMKVFSLDNLVPPIYVTFSVLFPPS